MFNGEEQDHRERQQQQHVNNEKLVVGSDNVGAKGEDTTIIATDLNHSLYVRVRVSIFLSRACFCLLLWFLCFYIMNVVSMV